MPHNTDQEKRQHRTLVRSILRHVIEIRPLIHRSKFSGKYNHQDVKKRLGKLRIDKDYAKKAIKNKYMYKRKYYRLFPDGKITFLFKTYASYNSPQLGHLKPKCIAETSNSTSKFLSRINQALPDLNIMSLEYAIDLYCPDHDAVANLFYLLRRYTYIHHAKRTSMIGGEFLGYEGNEVTRDTNAVSKIHFQEKKKGKKISSGKYAKIYERGDDNVKRTLPSGKKGWQHKDTNRVRLEVTIHRKNGTLAKNGIKTLSDLVQGPKFQEIIFPKSFPNAKPTVLDQIEFRNFIDRENGKLPSDYQDYLTKDPQGNMESFMDEYFRGKRLGINLSREMENSKNMEPLKTKMAEAAKLFDQNW